MSIEEKNKMLVCRAYELINQKKVEAAWDYFASECVCHIPDGDMSVKQTKDLDAMLFSAFPDYNLTIVDIIAEGDKVSFRVNLKGTNTGEMMGNPPTGNKVDITNSNWVRIVDNKIVELWVTMDRLSMIQQLGAIPSQ